MGYINISILAKKVIMKKILILMAILIGSLFALALPASASDAGGSVTVTVVPVDFCNPHRATGIVEVRGVDYVSGVVDVHMTLGVGQGEVIDVEGTIGEGGPGNYGFEYVDGLDETEVVFLSATYQTNLGFYESEVVSFFLDEMCNGVVATDTAQLLPAEVLPPTV